MENPGDLDLFTRLISDACSEAGRMIIEEYHSATRKVDLETDHDIKLAMDRQSEAVVIREIQKNFPEHAILSEERGLISGNDYLWMIDPVDGTVNYYYGLPWFCVSIACYRLAGNLKIHSLDDIPELDTLLPVAAGIYSPVEKKFYHSVMNQGSFLNHQPIQARAVRKLSQSILILNIGSSKEIIDKMSTLIRDLAPRVKKVRLLGSAALDIVSLASGEIGVCYYYGLKLWDLAAAVMIVRNSGSHIRLRRISGIGYEILGFRPGLETELKLFFPHLV